MQTWQRNRNYRRYRNGDGTFTYIIAVDGQRVEVSEDVFKAYAQADRRERYCAERDAGYLLSLERMDDDHAPLPYRNRRYAESAEDIVIREMLTQQALAAIASLPPEEQHLLHALYEKGMTEREYARAIGSRQSTIHKRKKNILLKISFLW